MSASVAFTGRFTLNFVSSWLKLNFSRYIIDILDAAVSAFGLYILQSSTLYTLSWFCFITRSNIIKTLILNMKSCNSKPRWLIFKESGFEPSRYLCLHDLEEASLLILSLLTEKFVIQLAIKVRNIQSNVRWIFYAACQGRFNIIFQDKSVHVEL